jgi:hypothetical protein
VGPGYSRDVEERIGGERKENDDTDRRKEGGIVIGSDPTIEHCDCLNKKKKPMKLSQAFVLSGT